MTKRKPARFSATKAVKANARERVGQPKPARVVDTVPRTGREIKHKPKLEDIIRQAEKAASQTAKNLDFDCGPRPGTTSVAM